MLRKYLKSLCIDSKNTGFTLAELLVTTLIMTVGIIGILAFITIAVRSSDLAKDITIATNHAEYLMDEISLQDTLADIIDTDWTAWAVSNSLDALSDELVIVTIYSEDGDSVGVASGGNSVCHIPKGNPSKAHTIEVGVKALSAHLAHGDYVGACVGETASSGDGVVNEGDLLEITVMVTWLTGSRVQEVNLTTEITK